MKQSSKLCSIAMACASVFALAAFAEWDSEEVERYAINVLRQDYLWIITPPTPEDRAKSDEMSKVRTSATGEAQKLPDRRFRHHDTIEEIEERWRPIRKRIEVNFTNNLAKCEEEWLMTHIGARHPEWLSFCELVKSNAHDKVAAKFPKIVK